MLVSGAGEREEGREGREVREGRTGSGRQGIRGWGSGIAGSRKQTEGRGKYMVR